MNTAVSKSETLFTTEGRFPHGTSQNNIRVIQKESGVDEHLRFFALEGCRRKPNDCGYAHNDTIDTKCSNLWVTVKGTRRSYCVHCGSNNLDDSSLMLIP